MVPPTQFHIQHNSPHLKAKRTKIVWLAIGLAAQGSQFFLAFFHTLNRMEIEIESLSSSLEQNFFSFFLPLLGVIDHKHPSRLHIIGIWYGHSCSVMYTVYTYNGKLPKQKSIEFHVYQWLWYPTLYSIRKLCPGNFISDHIILWCQNFCKYLPVFFYR